jgi:hypothetical protein
MLPAGVGHDRTTSVRKRHALRGSEDAEISAVSKRGLSTDAKTHPRCASITRIFLVYMYLQATFFGFHPQRHKRIMPT